MIDYVLLKKYIEQKGINGDKIYGAYWTKGSDPTLTRMNDAVGLTAAVGIDGAFAQNDFDTAQIYREIGEVTDELGNVFIRIPKFYIRKTDGTGFKTWQISKTKYPGFYLPWCFWDFTNGKELPYIDVGKYKASLSGDNKLESKPGVFPLYNKNIVDFRNYANYAKNNNVGGLAGYQQLDIHTIDVLRTLFIIEFATLNAQAILQGFSAGQWTADHAATVAETVVNRVILPNAKANLYRVGQTIGIGTTLGGNQIAANRLITNIETYDADNKAIVFDGDPVNIAIGNLVYNLGWKNGFSKSICASSGCIVANDGKYPMTYRGIESIYGDMWQFIDGVNINERQAWVCENADNYASNVFANPYKQLSYVNASADGYVKEMGFDSSSPFAELPTVVGGSSSEYYCDNYWQSTGQRIARFGGRWTAGSLVGVSCWDFAYASSVTDVGIGGRLLKKPL